MNDVSPARKLAPVSQPISPAKFAHFVLRTGQLDTMAEWYRTVLNARIVFRDERLCFLSYDDEHHRLALINMPGAGVLQRALGEHVGPLGQAAQRAADDLLGAAEAVRGRGVDPVDPELQRPVDGRDRLVILLWSPAELPATAADGPGAEADAADLQAGLAQRTGPELCLLHDVLPSTETVLSVSDSAPAAAALPGLPEYSGRSAGSHKYKTRRIVSNQ